MVFKPHLISRLWRPVSLLLFRSCTNVSWIYETLTMLLASHTLFCVSSFVQYSLGQRQDPAATIEHKNDGQRPRMITTAVHSRGALLLPWPLLGHCYRGQSRVRSDHTSGRVCRCEGLLGHAID